MDMIKEPIFFIENGHNILKFDTLDYASNYLEADYLDDNDIVIDSNFRKLKLFKKDKYGRVGFCLSDDTKLYDKVLYNYLKNYFKEESYTKNINLENLKLSELMEKMKSMEWIEKHSHSFLYDFWLWLKKMVNKT